MTTTGQTPSGPERRIDRLLAAYDEAHRSIVNRAVHWVTVPVMSWCVLAFLSAMPFPDALRLVPGLSWGVVGALALVLYTATMSRPLAVGVATFAFACLILAGVLARWGDTPLWQVALFVYVLAWVAQFLGYSLEARRPGFLEDARYLVSGPAWMLAAVCRRFGVRY